MNYRLNYDYLKKLKKNKFTGLLLLIIILGGIGLYFLSKVEIREKITCYGEYDGEMLKITIPISLSNTLRNNDSLIFNDVLVKYEIDEFLDYAIMDNLLYQNVSLIIDKDFLDNEVGIVEIEAQKESLIKYLIKLFK